MDDSKDVQKQDSLSKFLEMRDLRTNPFAANRFGERLYRRAERLCAALHVLTNHVPLNEPLRNHIREAGLSLLPAVLELKDEMRTVGSFKVRAFESRIRTSISLTRVLAASGYISIQNADAMCGALDELGVFINAAQRSNLSDGLSFTREELSDVRESERTYIKDIRDSRNITDTSDIKDTKRQSVGVQYSSPRDINTRSEAIMGVLRRLGELGIREVATQLPEYSEKMIQRELAQLIVAGKVKKSGFKRWSKYSIAS